MERYDSKNIVTIVTTVTERERVKEREMKNVQISQELFLALVKYFLLEQEECLPEIQKGLEQKLDALVMRELYTMVLVYKCGQEKLNNLYYQVKEQRRCSAWRKTKNPTPRNSSSRSWICTMPEELRIHNWNVNMA